MRVIWDLFGGGNNSVAKALKGDSNFFIYTFDVAPKNFAAPNYKYISLDLSQTNIVHCFEELLKSGIIEVPDIILASPLCQSFSACLSMLGGGTCFWKKSPLKGTLEAGTILVERTISEFEELKNTGFTKNLKAERQLFIKRLGEHCINNTINLIKHFKPDFWYIENPESSLIWFYIINNKKLRGFINKTSFGSYECEISKPTIFYSNVKMDNLKNTPFHPEFNEIEFDNKIIYLNKKNSVNDLKQALNKTSISYTGNLVWDSMGLAYEKEGDKKLICNNFYTYWKEINKVEYDNWLQHVESLRKQGSLNDKRTVKCVGDKFYQRYYVDIGFPVWDKTHCSLKKTPHTLGKLSKHIFKQEPGNTTKQVNEVTASTLIPKDLILDIIQHFKK